MSLSRRSFLKTSLASGAVLGFPAITHAVSPNGKLQHACIGTGNMAWADLNAFRGHRRSEIVALCDVDQTYLERAKKLLPNARLYRDWREMLEAEGDRIDSVNVSIPDHNHTIAVVNAMRKGKHVYCQKPLCHNMNECRVIQQVARKTGAVTQLGAQMISTMGERLTVQYLQNRIIGDVKKVTFFTTRNGGSRARPKLPAPSPVPATLNWDLWLGTAKERPYAKGVYHPTMWRIWRDLGCGWIGDMGCHLMSGVWLGMNMKATDPFNVWAEVEQGWLDDPVRRAATWPVGAHIVWDFPGNTYTNGSPLRFEWFDGLSDPSRKTPANLLPPAAFKELAKKAGLKELPLQGKVIEGTKGWVIHQHMGMPYVVMKEGVSAPKLEKLKAVASHHHNFLDCCLDRGTPRADFSWSAKMMECILLGEVAQLVPNQKLAWDSKAMKISNSAEATALLSRTYRKGWEL